MGEQDMSWPVFCAAMVLVAFMVGGAVGTCASGDHWRRVGHCEATGGTWLHEPVTIDGEEVHCIETPKAVGAEASHG